LQVLISWQGCAKVAMLENFVGGDFPVESSQREHLLSKCEMTDSVLYRLITDFSQHTVEGSTNIKARLHNTTGIAIPDSVKQESRHALHRGSQLAGAASDSVFHHGSRLARHVANDTAPKLRDAAGELSEKVAGHATNAAQWMEEQAARRPDRRLEAPSQTGGPAADAREADVLADGALGWQRRPDQELQELQSCSPSVQDILATCEELPFGESLPTVPLSVFGLFSIPLPCLHGSTCELSMKFEKYDFPYTCFLASWLLAFCCARAWFHHRIDELTHATVG